MYQDVGTVWLCENLTINPNQREVTVSLDNRPYSAKIGRVFGSNLYQVSTVELMPGIQMVMNANSSSDLLHAHSLDADDVRSALETSAEGLSQSEAANRLATHGENTLPESKPDTLLRVFARQFLSPLIYVLLAAALVSLALREWTDAIFIFAVLILNAVIGTAQEYHAQRSALALRKMVSSQATVVRDAESYEIDARELVPGDMVLLSAGAKVPADIRLSRSLGLQIDESLLTGESVPVDKNAKSLLDENTVTADRTNMAFAGSLVSHGRGQGFVVATGTQTVIGALATSLAEQEEAKPPLIRRMEQFTIRITLALAVIIIILGFVQFVQGAGWHEVLLVSVALAVSAVPEGLPVAVTIALAIGMNRMARRNVIVRQLVAVEALGSCTFIASDKTGTLTLNELTCRRLAFPDTQTWEITGEGTVPEGSVITPNGAPTPEETTLIERICLVAALCNEGFLGKRDGGWTSHGDTVDIALLVMAHKIGITQALALNRFPLRESIPYESERGFAATLHRDEEGERICVKGALERILPMCRSMATVGGDQPIDEAKVMAMTEQLASEGYRVLAFAEAQIVSKGGNDFADEHLKELTFLGLVGMIDPLRPESKAAISACQESGLQVSMVTGDHPLTAYAISRELNLAQSIDQVVVGQTIADSLKQGNDRLDEVTRDARVFARVEPQQKLEIVRSLARNGHFVAVTGDGVNDAPALTSAHAGIAMGKRGTDVARESAHLIITDDNFASIVAGIEEGRIAYQNIRKVIYLLISTGAAEVVLFTLSLLFGLPMPLTAVQLLWLNLVTNGIQDVALAFEPGEGNEMKSPPRKPKEPIFNRLMIERVAISAAVMGTLAFLVFHQLLASGMSEFTARNSVLLLMVLFENVHIGNCRSETKSAFALSPFRNRLLLIGTIAAQLIHIGALYTPGLSTILKVEPVTFDQWLQLAVVALGVLFVNELHKLFVYKFRVRKRN